MLRDRTVYEISLALRPHLRGLGVEVIYGDERFERGAVSRSVIQVRETGNEAFRVAAVVNAEVEGDAGQIIAYRDRAVEVVIEAKDNRGGAMEHHHKDAVNELIAAFWTALLVVCWERKQSVKDQAATGKFESTPQLLEAGARYRMAFQITASIRAASLDAVATESVDGSTLVPVGTTKVGLDGTTQAVCQPEDP